MFAEATFSVPQHPHYRLPFETPENHVDHEEFRTRVEAEALRHKRYLVPFSLVRIIADRGLEGAALDEALATETRCTDTVCRMPDGSRALLLLQADTGEATVVVRRIVEVVKELASDANIRAAVASTAGRRVEADELWLAVSKAFVVALESEAHLVLAR